MIIGPPQRRQHAGEFACIPLQFAHISISLGPHIAVLMGGDQGAGARRDAEPRGPPCTEGGVLAQEVVAVQRATARAGAGPRPQARRKPTREHGGDAMREAYPAQTVRIGLAEVVQERGDQQIGVALAAREERAQDPRRVALIGRREEAESAKLRRG